MAEVYVRNDSNGFFEDITQPVEGSGVLMPNEIKKLEKTKRLATFIRSGALAELAESSDEVKTHLAEVEKREKETKTATTSAKKGTANDTQLKKVLDEKESALKEQTSTITELNSTVESQANEIQRLKDELAEATKTTGDEAGTPAAGTTGTKKGDK